MVYTKTELVWYLSVSLKRLSEAKKWCKHNEASEYCYQDYIYLEQHLKLYVCVSLFILLSLGTVSGLLHDALCRNYNVSFIHV